MSEKEKPQEPVGEPAEGRKTTDEGRETKDEGSISDRVEGAVVTLRTAEGRKIALTLDEYRLALVGLVDFEGDWEVLEMAAGHVVEGQAKQALVRERLLPEVEHLPALLSHGIDALELLAARLWFRQERLG